MIALMLERGQGQGVQSLRIELPGTTALSEKRKPAHGSLCLAQAHQQRIALYCPS